MICLRCGAQNATVRGGLLHRYLGVLPGEFALCEHCLAILRSDEHALTDFYAQVDRSMLEHMEAGGRA